jgi:hypothetical protein
MTILLPPPFPPGHRGAYGRSDLEPIARDHPRRFAFVAGGESLNPLIHRVAPEKVTPGTIRELQQEAEAIVKAGAGSLLAKHPNLSMSLKVDARGPQRTAPFGPEGSLRPDWLTLLREFYRLAVPAR